MGRIKSGTNPIEVERNLHQYRLMLNQKNLGRRKIELLESLISDCEEYLDRISSNQNKYILQILQLVKKLNDNERMDLVGALLE